MTTQDLAAALQRAAGVLRRRPETGQRCSPIPNAVQNAVPVAVRIDLDAG